MHLFDPNGNSVESKTPFIVTVILLSLATYAVASWGLWLVDHSHRGHTNNQEMNPGETTQNQATQIQETDGLDASKGNGCLDFLRRRGTNREAV